MATLVDRSAALSRARHGWGVWFLSLLAVFTMVSPFLADWNATHIYNPHWPPHAKFHNAQTMCFGVLCGAIAIVHLWWPAVEERRSNLRTGAIFAGLYWAAQLPAILFPGTAFYDPDNAAFKPHLFGVEIVQAHLASLFLVLTALAWWSERRSLLRKG